ncbi:MAG TPA: DoxX family protein [Chloroflexota bacterium]
MKDVGPLVLRVVSGGLMAGHGAQKLFGAFGGPGRHGTAGFMESLGLAPGHLWGAAAGASEFGGGALLALGLLNPLGPIGVISAMTMATGTAHRGKPIWAMAGGAELPVINMAAALAIAIGGPGAFSLDHVLGIKVPPALTAIAALSAAGMLAYGMSRHLAAAAPAKEEARTTLQSGGEQP